LGSYNNLKVEWVPGMAPTAVFMDANNGVIKTVEVGDKDFKEVMELLKTNDFEPKIKSATFPESPNAVAEFGGHTYHLYITQAFWKESQEFAESKKPDIQGGGYLVTIDSEEEEKFVQDLLKKNNIDAAWLGAQDASEEAEWKWVVGPEKDTLFWSRGKVNGVYSNFKEGEPNDTNDEDCGVVTIDGWNDADCLSARLSVVVEYGERASTTTNEADAERVDL